VKLERDDGKLLDVPLVKLSSADRNYVADAFRIDATALVALGRIAEVQDGHRVALQVGPGKLEQFRLEGIDAPDSGQKNCAAARQALGEKLLNRIVWLNGRQSMEAEQSGASVPAGKGNQLRDGG
jgi:endonuclease YncB( thermonuclease family)